MPFVTARLPVLKSLHVRDDVHASLRVHAVLLEERGHLGEGGVLELLQSGGEQVVDGIGGLLCVAAEESLEDQYAVVELAFVFDLALVGEEVVAQVHPVGEGVSQHLHRPGGGYLGRDLGACGVFDEVGRPGGAADLAPHLDVFDGVGNTALVDVG